MRARFGTVLAGALAVFVALALTAAPPPARAGANYVYLRIDLFGTGSGSVRTLDGPGGVPDNNIDCRMVNGVVGEQEVCAQQWDAGDDGVIRVYYRVEPAPGSCVISIGPCTASGHSTYIDLNSEDHHKSFTFNLIVYDVTVQPAGPGSGSIVTDELTIQCPGDCTAKYYYGHPVRLTATASTGSHFVSWAGDCAGQPALCQITISSNVSATANFALGPAPTPIVTPAVTPVVTPATTPKVTPRASTGATPRASATTKPPTSTSSTTTAPGASVAASAAGASAGPSASALGSAGPTVLDGTIGPPSPGDSPGAAATAPVVLVGSEPGSGSDLTPIILAILGAGLFIAIAIGLVGFGLVRRSRGSSGAPPSA